MFGYCCITSLSDALCFWLSLHWLKFTSITEQVQICISAVNVLIFIHIPVLARKTGPNLSSFELKISVKSINIRTTPFWHKTKGQILFIAKQKGNHFRRKTKGHTIWPHSRWLLLKDVLGRSFRAFTAMLRNWKRWRLSLFALPAKRTASPSCCSPRSRFTRMWVIRHGHHL